jgi:hypothetical protein
MAKSISLETLQKASAEYAIGLRSIETRLKDLEMERVRLLGEQRATAGARFAIEKLIATTTEADARQSSALHSV